MTTTATKATTTPTDDRTALHEAIRQVEAERAQLDARASKRQQDLVEVQAALTGIRQALQQARSQTKPGDLEANKRVHELEHQDLAQQRKIAEAEKQAADEEARDKTRRAALEQDIRQFKAALEEAERLQVADEEDRASALRQVLQNAEMKLKLLAQEEQELQARLPAIQAQATAAQSRIDTAIQRARQAQDNAYRKREEYELAQTQASLAKGTSISQEKNAPLKAQANHLKEAERERDALVTESERIQAKDIPSLERLRTEQEQCQARLQALPGERQHLEQAKFQAHQELGQEIRREVHVQLLLADVNIDLLQRQLDAAKQARQTIIQQDVERLAEWPALQLEVKQCLPFVEDDTYAVLEAAHNYMQTLLTRGRGMADTLSSPSIGPYVSHWSLLPIPADEIFTYEHIKGNPTRLRAHDAVVAQIMHEWKALKQR